MNLLRLEVLTTFLTTILRPLPNLSYKPLILNLEYLHEEGTVGPTQGEGSEPKIAFNAKVDNKLRHRRQRSAP